jgi:hypothetical protein
LLELLWRQKATIRAEVFAKRCTLRPRDVPGNRINGFDFTTKASFGAGIDQGQLRLTKERL